MTSATQPADPRRNVTNQNMLKTLLAALVPTRQALFLLGLLLAFVLPVCLGCYFAGLSKRPPTIFFEERHTVTFFSAAFMLGTSLTAFIIGWIHVRVDHTHPLANFWRLSGCGFLYLAMDDYFQAHEGMDTAVFKLFNTSQGQHQYDGLVIGAFGLIALTVCIVFRFEILKYRTFTFFVALAGVCMFGTVLCDQLEATLSHDIGVVIEESFKLMAATLLLAAYQTVLFDFLRRLLLPARN